MKISKLSQQILLLVIFLSGVGLVQIYSSSYIFATESFENGLLFFKKQSLFTFIGFIGLFSLTFLSWPKSRVIGISLWFFSLLTLVLTLIPDISASVGGSRRWLDVSLGFRFQPSEWLKITCPFALIYFMVLKEKWPLHRHLYWLTAGFSVVLPILVLMSQPDFGSVVILFCWLFFIVFIMGLKWRYVFLSLALSSASFLFLVFSRGYRVARMQAFLDPWQDPLGIGFQIIQSLIGFHSGGFFGQGLGQGQSKLFFLPEAHTDFTLAVLGEELGFLGFIVILLLYAYLIYCIVKVAIRTVDISKKLVVVSILFMFVMNTFVHFGVNLGLLPPTGVVLPFLSYGGNAIVTTLLGFGWIIQIENENT